MYTINIKGENMEKNNYAYIAIVAIVIIVALVSFLGGNGATKVVNLETASDAEQANIAGEARFSKQTQKQPYTIISEKQIEVPTCITSFFTPMSNQVKYVILNYNPTGDAIVHLQSYCTDDGLKTYSCPVGGSLITEHLVECDNGCNEGACQ